VSKGFSLVNATSVNPTVWIKVQTVSLSAAGMNGTLAAVSSLLQNYGQGATGNAVYAWTDASGNVNFGVLNVPSPGVTQLYYVTVTT
jgi:hypothetical protein